MGRRPGPSALASLSSDLLAAELQRRKRSLNPLLRKHARLSVKLAKLEKEIAAAGGAVSGGGRGGARGPRPKNEMSLPDAMHKVLNGKTMGVSELADAVKKSGYRTNAANFRVMVNQALLKHRKRFKKIERGQYTTA